MDGNPWQQPNSNCIFWSAGSVLTQPTRMSTHHPYTCLACALAFTTAETQRTHYSTDLHRYNSKRAVAGLNPIDINTFNLKFNHNNTTTHPQHQPPLRCQPCHKSFSTHNAYKNHLTSKKHIQQQLKDSQKTTTHEAPLKSSDATTAAKVNEMHLDPTPSTKPPSGTGTSLDQLIQLRMEQAPEIQPTECLFCPQSKNPLQFDDVDHVLKHMLTEHGFFLPDQEFLVDKVGLLKYLAQTIAVWNVCIFCGTGFGGKIQDDMDLAHLASATRNGLNNVRKHMCDKNHCKLAWDSEEDRLEYSDFFDYRSSYKNYGTKKPTTKSKKISVRARVEEEEEGDSEWEDEDESMNSSDDEAIPQVEGRRTASYGDSMFEIVLPNGVRLGHRSLRHIYKQNLLPYSVGSQSTQAGNRNMNLITRLAILSNQSSALIKQQTEDPITHWRRGQTTAALSLSKQALIPAKGAGINFNLPHSNNHNTLDQVMKVKDVGQARFAGHHIRTFKDTNKRLQFQNRVSCKSGNNQKHYRDPLLQ